MERCVGTMSEAQLVDDVWEQCVDTVCAVQLVGGGLLRCVRYS